MNEEMIGLIPAAGRGVRLGLPYPKELYPIIRDNRYKPVAQFVLENLTAAGLRHVVFVVNESKHQLMGYFGDGNRFGCNLSYVVQESVNSQSGSTSPGLAHALHSAHHLVQGRTVFFGMADTIMHPVNVYEIAYAASTAEDDAILVLFATSRPEKFGMVRLDGDGRVIEIIDKPKRTDLSEMWGCIIWRSRFTEYLSDCVVNKQVSDFATIMNSAIRDGLRFRGVRIADGTYLDLGTYEEIMELDRRFRLE